MRLYYDIHIHSCLSPCADNDMTPNNIINMASLLGLDVIAVSDHNSAKNLPAVFTLGKKAGITVIPAIEVTTAEEVHVLCLFYTLDDAIDFSEMLYDNLMFVKNRPDIFGEQYVMNEKDEIIATEEKLLINAAAISIDNLLSTVGNYHGVLIPAHIDKTSNSIISNLGFIPPQYNIKCVEVKNPPYESKLKMNVITNSDSHTLESMREPTYYVNAPENTIKAFIDAIMTQ